MSVLSDTYTVRDLARDAQAIDLRNRVMPAESTVAWAQAQPEVSLLQCVKGCGNIVTIEYPVVCRECTKGYIR